MPEPWKFPTILLFLEEQIERHSNLRGLAEASPSDFDPRKRALVSALHQNRWASWTIAAAARARIHATQSRIPGQQRSLHKTIPWRSALIGRLMRIAFFPPGWTQIAPGKSQSLRLLNRTISLSKSMGDRQRSVHRPRFRNRRSQSLFSEWDFPYGQTQSVWTV